jgi:hypothetical protein
MPVVVFQYNPKRMPLRVVHLLEKALTQVVSAGLDIPGWSDARLTPDDIEVWATPFSKSDLNTKDFAIMVWAHQYPERMLKLEDCKNGIVLVVSGVLINEGLKLRGWVWVLLQPSAFGKIG